jgi:hypothetical protein
MSSPLRHVSRAGVLSPDSGPRSAPSLARYVSSSVTPRGQLFLVAIINHDIGNTIFHYRPKRSSTQVIWLLFFFDDPEAWKPTEISLMLASQYGYQLAIARALDLMGCGRCRGTSTRRRGDYENAYGAYEAAETYVIPWH